MPETPDYPYIDVTPVAEPDVARARFREWLQDHGTTEDSLSSDDVSFRWWYRPGAERFLSIGIKRNLFSQLAPGEDPPADAVITHPP